jgi:hypothetical protein
MQYYDGGGVLLANIVFISDDETIRCRLGQDILIYSIAAEPAAPNGLVSYN